MHFAKRHLLYVAIILVMQNTLPASDAEVMQPQRTIEFAGYTWNVRSSYGGPGPNYWSDTAENVWIDENGYLHMRIRKIGDRWYCSEIYTNHFSQYGKHIFVVEGRIAEPDKNTVLGLFNYANDTHEIDIEFSRWGNENYANTTSYTIQPYTVSGNSQSYALKIDSLVSIHQFDWQSNFIAFSSFQGSKATPSGSLKNWVYTGSYNPKDTDNLRVHINFWLFQGRAPVDTTRLEVIIRDLTIPKPLGTAIDEDEISAPQGYHLEQNYPNPFNPGTTIRYNLAKPQRVDLRIYDISGKLISTLVDSDLGIGQHEAKWNGMDLNDKPAAGGVYVYTLRAGNFTEAKKMLLIR